jgi:hypothetical protein
MTDTQTDSISLQTAVSVAIEFVKKIYATNQIKDILLEEVEFSESTNQWLITIGFTINKFKENSSYSIAHLISPELISPKLIPPEGGTIRKYKIVHIDAQSGKPISMKIREI